jgi:Tfp pilus assembly protein PilX
MNEQRTNSGLSGALQDGGLPHLKEDRMKNHCRFEREGGTIMPIALVLLLLLTMIGIAATMTSEVEIRIAGNEVAYKENLYYAEGSAMAGVQELENEPDASLKDLSLHWLHGSLPNTNISSDTNWIDDNNAYTKRFEGVDYTFLAVYQGIDPGGSLDIGGTTTNLHRYTIYGRSARKNGEAIIEVGYKRRF